MNENQFDAQAVQQSQVMDDAAQIRVSERIAAEVYDKGFAAMSVDIGSRGANQAISASSLDMRFILRRSI